MANRCRATRVWRAHKDRKQKSSLQTYLSNINKPFRESVPVRASIRSVCLRSLQWLQHKGYSSTGVSVWGVIFLFYKNINKQAAVFHVKTKLKTTLVCFCGCYVGLLCLHRPCMKYNHITADRINDEQAQKQQVWGVYYQIMSLNSFFLISCNLHSKNI